MSPITGTIAHLDTHDIWGGGQYQVLHLLAGLAGRGVSALLVAPGHGELARRARAAGLRVVDLRPALVHRWHPGGGRVLGDLFREHQVSLVHTHDARALTLAHRASRSYPVPIVHSRRVVSPLRRNPWSRRKYSPLRVAAIIATSRAVGEAVVASGYPASRTFVVESGTDCQALAAKPPHAGLRAWAGGRPLIGGVGKLVPKKNWELLLRTAAELARRGRDLRWVVAGDGPERSRLEQLARCLDIGDRLTWLPGDEDPERVVKALDVMFHPSRREGSGAIVRVAMLSRVPVVAVEAPAIADALGGCGLLVGPDDLAGSADAIEHVLADGRARERMLDGAERAARQRFDFDGVVTGTLGVYDAVLGGQG